MQTITHIRKCSRHLACLAVLLWLNKGFAQQRLNYTIQSPEPNSVVAAGNLFVSLTLTDKKFTSEDVRVLIDRVDIPVKVKVAEKRLSFVYSEILTDGKHRLDIWAKVSGESGLKLLTWNFYVNVKNDSLKNDNGKPASSGLWGMSGNLVADNRSEFLSGTGALLRQEPGYTRTISLNLTARYKNAQMPLRFFGTSDNYGNTQSRNFFQAGFQNKWFEATYGDINPALDRLVLSGIRMRGMRTAVKAGASSLQFYYGELNQAQEGKLETYQPGSGYLPQNLINDSQYVSPGIYRRWMMAGRLEIANKRDFYKVGLNAFKAKDDVRSIRYGIAPKDNLAAGIDVGFKLFKRSLAFNLGWAASAITNDISYGVIDKQQIDTTFKTHLPFNPREYQDFLIMNSSTVPIIPRGDSYMAYYGNVAYSNRFQTFTFEYRKNGPQFTSLGNPFLRNNYEGFVTGERVSVWKRKITLNVNYQNFRNDLNSQLMAKMKTQILNSSVFFTYSPRFPSLLLSYMYQGRNTENAIVSSALIKDRMDMLMISLNYSRTFWGLNHNFRALSNMTQRTDAMRPLNRTDFYNYMFGIGEGLPGNVSVNFDAGKTIVGDSKGERISDINTYNGSIDWQIKPQKTNVALSISNNITWATLLSNKSQRFSVSGRAGHVFYKGMRIDLEYGYSPYRDETMSINNYDEHYVYIRYSYDFNFR